MSSATTKSARIMLNFMLCGISYERSMRGLFRKDTPEKAFCPKVIDLVAGVYPETKLVGSLARLLRRDEHFMRVRDRNLAEDQLLSEPISERSSLMLSRDGIQCSRDVAPKTRTRRRSRTSLMQPQRTGSRRRVTKMKRTIELLLKLFGTLFRKMRRRNMANHISLPQHRIQQAMAVAKLDQIKLSSKNRPQSPLLQFEQKPRLLDNILIDL